MTIQDIADGWFRKQQGWDGNPQALHHSRRELAEYLTAALVDVRAAALEEAAKVAEEFHEATNYGEGKRYPTIFWRDKDMAAAIRSLARPAALKEEE